MECFWYSESEDESKPCLTTVSVKQEPECETVDSTETKALQYDLYDVRVKVEPLDLDPGFLTEFKVDNPVPCLTVRCIKADTMLDEDFDTTNDSHIITNRDGLIEVCITKESCSSPTLDDSLYKCRICQKTFNDHSSLTTHMSVHVKDDSSSKKKLKNSYLYEETIICKTCEKPFTSLTPYLKHRQTHLFEKPFECEICEKEFKSKYLLTNHERTHTGEKPFSCDLCAKTFTEKVNLNRHKKSHSGAKPYNCDVCGNKFSSKQTLTDHVMGLHTSKKLWPFECEVCKTKKPTMNDLKRHLRAHTGIKYTRVRQYEYICDICKKSYNRKYHLADHIRSHNNDKPFACEICKRRFIRSHDCKMHLKVHMKHMIKQK